MPFRLIKWCLSTNYRAIKHIKPRPVKSYPDSLIPEHPAIHKYGPQLTLRFISLGHAIYSQAGEEQTKQNTRHDKCCLGIKTLRTTTCVLGVVSAQVPFMFSLVKFASPPRRIVVDKYRAEIRIFVLFRVDYSTTTPPIHTRQLKWCERNAHTPLPCVKLFHYPSVYPFPVNMEVGRWLIHSAE